MDYNRIVFISYIQKTRTLLSMVESLPVESIIVKQTKRFVPNTNDVIVFWGAGRIPSWYEKFKNKIVMINNPYSINIAGNKLLTFNKLKDNMINIPNYAINKYNAASLIRPVVVRNVLRGSGGIGIDIVEENEELPAAPLYVEYINKEKEYRVHVFNNEVIKYSRKIARKTVEHHDKYVWNHDKGYYFNKVKQNVEAGEVAISAVKALGLDFGAVDLVLKDNKYYVLEVNTAPGLQNNSLEVYKNAILNYIESQMEQA